MSTEKNETGKTYAEIWGEAIHSNRHLRVLTMGLGGIYSPAGSHCHPALVG